MNHCFMSCIHRALKSAAPKLKRQFCGSASNTKADSEGKRLRETTIQWIPGVTLHMNIWVVSDSLKGTLTRSKFQNFPGGTCPQTPLDDCTWSIYKASFSAFWSNYFILQAVNTRRPGNKATIYTRVHGQPHRTNPHSICIPPPSSISGSAPAFGIWKA